MPATVSACLIIDTSASMSPWIANTVIDSKAFVSYSLAGDAIAVVNYDVNANNCYAPNGQMAVVDSTLSQLPAATAAISALTFNGNCTNIGGGIQKAYALLGGSGVAPRAAVLLTDGQQNCGIDPINVPATYPVYPCGMGDYVSVSQLQTIASRTNGVYYAIPRPINMMQIYNQIRSIQPRIQSVLNHQFAVSSSQPTLLLPASIAASSDLQQVGVVWDNTSYVYANNPQPTGNQVYAALYQPNGQLLPGPPARIGSGYVIFDVPSPTPGIWSVYFQYSGTLGGLNVTAGVFEFTPASQSEVRLEIDAPAVMNAGSPLAIKAQLLHENGDPVPITSATAEVASPGLSVKNALVKHADDLKGLSPLLDEPSHDEDTPERRLIQLHGLLLPGHDILPRRTRAAPMAAGADGSHHAVFADTAQGGAHNVLVRAQGYCDKSKSVVQRTQLATVHVADN
jgi:hypothetical protein